MGSGWMIAGVAFGATLMGFCVGFLLGGYFAYRYMVHAVAAAGSRADQERDRADRAVDSLSRQLRGEPISIAAVQRQEASFEKELREREELQEMFGPDIDEEPGVPTE